MKNCLCFKKGIFKEPYSLPNHVSQAALQLAADKKDTQNLVITPCSTPNQKRKDTNRRRSNLFTV